MNISLGNLSSGAARCHFLRLLHGRDFRVPGGYQFPAHPSSRWGPGRISSDRKSHRPAGPPQNPERRDLGWMDIHDSIIPGPDLE